MLRSGANGSSLILPSEVATQPRPPSPLATTVRSRRRRRAVFGRAAPLGEIGRACPRRGRRRRGAALRLAPSMRRWLATQAASCDTVYNPLEGVIAPVIEATVGWDPATTSDDWAYVLFDWDTHCGACSKLDRAARQLSYSVLISVIKAKSAEGFASQRLGAHCKSTHSQPPVGAKVLREMR